MIEAVLILSFEVLLIVFINVGLLLSPIMVLHLRSRGVTACDLKYFENVDSGNYFCFSRLVMGEYVRDVHFHCSV